MGEGEHSHTGVLMFAAGFTVMMALVQEDPGCYQGQGNSGTGYRAGTAGKAYSTGSKEDHRNRLFRRDDQRG